MSELDKYESLVEWCRRTHDNHPAQLGEITNKLWIEYAALEAKLEALKDALIWCSGSDDFNEGGTAREGWLKVCQPLLAAAQEEQAR